ncbi:MAG: acyl-CoA dehydrogenase [Deltaproteobacteria bacterium HGW-Deltaproteobacteria-21]|nr:MAG: acyl-CoA dehydrogenase [Deltaproteobacteria bacterium HGW-Deltaproteobacteria-21]
MAQLLADKRDQDFVIWEQLNGEAFLRKGPYSGYDRKMCEMILTEAKALAVKEVLPTLAEGDRTGLRYENGKVVVPECFHRAFDLILEGGWNNLGIIEDMGGQGAPPFITAAAAEYFMAANYGLYVYTTMGNGTADMIYKFGTPEQKAMYVENLTSAKWGGTMLLTESEAGSDVGALTTTAVRNPDGTFTLTGNKIFITNGEFDLVENIIHPVLARIEGDPPGTKGISIFIVPKFFVNPDGTLGERNGISCEGIEHKHGIVSSATCSMTLGAKGKCIGFMLGQERKGMNVMFHMINGARMSVSLQALSYSSACYLLAVDYARKRIQGRSLENFADASAPSVPIIRHPDVRRNLLWMKAQTEAMRSFYQWTIMCGMKAAQATDEKERRFYEDLYSMMTPIAKDYIGTRGHEVCNQAIQVYGGAGYTKDYPVEQYTRDCRITTIYEGTTGIQAMDLLARKIGRQNGAVFMHLIGEMNKTVAEAKQIPELKGMAEKLEASVTMFGATAMKIGTLAMSPGFNVAFAHSVPFLHTMGDVIMGWMLLWRAAVAASKIEGAKGRDTAFYKGQIKSAQFYMDTVLPVVNGRMQSIQDASPAAMEIEEESFGGI